MLILQFLPTVGDLVGASAARVAGVLLRHFVALSWNGEQWVQAPNELAAIRKAYGSPPPWEAGRALSEAWSLLENQGLVVHDPEARDWGRYIVSRAGLKAAAAENFEVWSADRELPANLLHPTVVVDALPLFREGDYDTAVFKATRALEVAIRRASKAAPGKIGVPLARDAFKAGGALTDPTAQDAEQEALSNLMAGVLGSYKNPTSHRHIAIGAADAREVLVMVSHLLKIVDGRPLTFGS